MSRGAFSKAKGNRNHTNATDISKQIAVLLKSSQDILGKIFTQIIPFGDYYKKNKAVEINRLQRHDIKSLESLFICFSNLKVG